MVWDICSYWARLGGSVFHFLKSSCTSPTGERLLGGVHGVRMNAPRLGSAFAAWTMVYSTVQCSMQYIHQNNAPGLNSLLASAAASGFVHMRRGVDLPRAWPSSVGCLPRSSSLLRRGQLRTVRLRGLIHAVMVILEQDFRVRPDVLEDID
ncbi:hypothetical protein QJS04_geneDACA014759 [Acorus gramineus]|uniref:Uncharacterized protein n=1 Tax=Acorus gramineus TaxID=55184 RepID=A0AAV9BQC5_ACOGR|nr:hypothetical protein QJS04_geneDACA014759 [Acorus gramineus]